MVSDKYVAEFQRLYKEKCGEELSWSEAYDQANRLVGLVKLLYDLNAKELELQRRLEKEPKGFHLEGKGYTCPICSYSISDEQTWYDKWGMKCLVCQKAINEKRIPGSLARNRDSWYSTHDLENRFNIDRHALKMFIKEKILKPRIVINDKGSLHVQLFLIKDNKDALPPKKLTESQLVKEAIDGREMYHSEPWYKFVDPYQHLKGYKIMDYIKFNKVMN